MYKCAHSSNCKSVIPSRYNLHNYGLIELETAGQFLTHTTSTMYGLISNSRNSPIKRYVPVPGLYWADAASIGPVMATNGMFTGVFLDYRLHLVTEWF